VSAVRSTESSSQSASAAVGLNEVFTAGSTQSFLSGRVAANGSWTAERTRLAVFANVLRESTFVNAGTAEGVTLAQTYRTAPGFGGTVSYALTDRLAAVAGASWGGNYYAPAARRPRR
jgi:hypothetical protein